MQDIYDYYKGQTVFLTGATGGLGACIMWQLTDYLNVSKVFLLVRQTHEQFIQRFTEIMPQQVPKIEERLKSGQIVLVKGDITQEKFGISDEDLATLQRETTILIHSAASISLVAKIADVIKTNCIPTLKLAEMSMHMPNLKYFVHVSSSYANTFLPDGVVEEKVYEITPDAEKELAQILETGDSPHVKDFPWPYGYSKQLTERLLGSRFPQLPLLIVSPAIIGPAICQPFPMYGPKGSCPINILLSRLMKPTDNQANAVFYSPSGGNNILDEIPVDIVGNVLLRHVHAGTKGVVHASSAYYFSKSVGWMFKQMEESLPPRWIEKISRHVFTADINAPLCKEAKFYNMVGREWIFVAPSAKLLNKVEGPLAIDIETHNIDEYFQFRLKCIFEETFGAQTSISSTVSASNTNKTKASKMRGLWGCRKAKA